MDELEKLYKKLEKYNDFSEEENCEKFSDIVDLIALQKDFTSIPILLKYFNNEAPIYIMENLMLAIENYGPQYSTELLKYIEEQDTQHICLFEGLFYGIFNNLEYLNHLKTNLKHYPKKALLKLFDIMEQESPHHRDLILELRQQLNKIKS